MDPILDKEALADFTRPSHYELQKFLIDDGEKHPFALILPGGAYAVVCNFIEGKPYAEALKKKRLQRVRAVL